MELRKIKPKRLSAQVKYMYVLRTGDHNLVQNPHSLIPDGTFELIINLGGPVYHYDENMQGERRPQAMVVGGFKKKFVLHYAGPIHMVGVVFNPGYNACIFKDKVNNYSESLIQADLLLGSSIHNLVEMLHATNNVDRIRDILEHHLVPYFESDQQAVNSKQLHAVIAGIQHGKGSVDFARLSSQVCMSERNFRRVFTENIGMSPKEYARIIRAKNTMHLLKKRKSIAEIAYTLNFYDPAHLVNDFKKISGISPAAYMQQLNPIDESFIRVSEYARV